MSKNGGETFNFIFHLEAFVVSPSSFFIEKLVSDFSICVYVWGETFNFIFHREDFCGFAVCFYF